MRLKTVTLLAAITQLLTVLCSIFSYVRFFQKIRWADNAEWFLMQPIYLLGHIMLAVFLFTLVAKQKSN